MVAVIGAVALFVLDFGTDDNGDDSATITTTTEAGDTTTTTAAPPQILVNCAPPDPDPATTATSADTPPDDTAPPTTDPVSLVPTLGENSTVSTIGLDSVTFGLTVAEAERAAGTQLNPCGPVAECYRVTPVQAPEGISFVVTAGTIERVDIIAGPVTTRSGIGIGSTTAEIEELFAGSLEPRDNPDGTVDVVFIPSDGADTEFRVVFTTRDDVVERFRAGRLPLVDEPVGCG